MSGKSRDQLVGWVWVPVGKAVAENTNASTPSAAARGEQAVASIRDADGRARFVPAELATAEGIRALVDEVGSVDVLVNNAGVFPFAATNETTSEQLAEVLDINVAAPFRLTAGFAPGMADRGDGAIVNVSSMAASFGLPGLAAYGASKAAVELLTKSWAAEYGPQGVRVNAVAPGPTRTPTAEAMGDGLDQLASTLPLGRPAEMDEIASTIVFLASDDATYINGAILAVDGGRTAV